MILCQRRHTQQSGLTWSSWGWTSRHLHICVYPCLIKRSLLPMLSIFNISTITGFICMSESSCCTEPTIFSMTGVAVDPEGVYCNSSSSIGVFTSCEGSTTTIWYTGNIGWGGSLMNFANCFFNSSIILSRGSTNRPILSNIIVIVKMTNEIQTYG